MLTKKLGLIMLVYCFLSGMKTANAQIEMQVFGSVYPSQIKRYVEDCLLLLEIDKKIGISIFISEQLPFPYQGRTIKHDIDNTGIDRFSVYVQAGLSDEKQLLVLAHELIHIKQYASRKLDIHGDDIYWHGKKFYLNQNQLDSTPWENEAYADDDRLAKRFLAIRKQTQKSIREMMAKNEGSNH